MVEQPLNWEKEMDLVYEANKDYIHERKEDLRQLRK